MPEVSISAWSLHRGLGRARQWNHLNALRREVLSYL